jgi:hypothetical protein
MKKEPLPLIPAIDDSEKSTAYLADYQQQCDTLLETVPVEDVVLALKEARERIACGWIQGRYADSDIYESATRFCAVGALFHIRHGVPHVGNAARIALNIASVERTGYDVVTYNDKQGTTQEDVLRVYDAAIAAVSGRLAP